MTSHSKQRDGSTEFYSNASLKLIDDTLYALRARITRRALAIARVYGRDTVSVEDAVQAVGDVMKGVGQ